VKPGFFTKSRFTAKQRPGVPNRDFDVTAATLAKAGTKAKPRAEELRYFPEFLWWTVRTAERRGCPACRYKGISGRLAIIEMMPVDDKIAGFLVEHSRADQLRKTNRSMGLSLLFGAGELIPFNRRH
jgi:type II secretory ATPase GspE/PulE/Tfp pilus assembly ATPase PilB-like protein